MKIQYEFIRDEAERLFVKTAAASFQRAEQQYRPFFTDFYDADWMQGIMQQYFSGAAEERYTFFGGYETAQRQMMCICPYELRKEEWEMSALQLQVRTGLGKALTHRDYLGAILGLGIERKLIGDIVVKPSGAYVIVKSSIAPYIRSQLISIGRYQKLEIEEVDLDALEIEPPKVKQLNSTVTSLRADAVAAVCFGISRSECAKLIQGEKLRCNGKVVGVSTPIQEGNVLALRGYGKAKLASINGQTKKERLHITVEKYI